MATPITAVFYGGPWDGHRVTLLNDADVHTMPGGEYERDRRAPGPEARFVWRPER